VSGVLAINTGHGPIGAGTKTYPTPTLTWVCQLVMIDGKATRAVRGFNIIVWVLWYYIVAERLRDNCAAQGSHPLVP